jgi:hypothetical protein
MVTLSCSPDAEDLPLHALVRSPLNRSIVGTETMMELTDEAISVSTLRSSYHPPVAASLPWTCLADHLL